MSGLQSQLFALAAAAEGGSAEGGMPQFDPSVVESQLVWLVITFGLLYFLMARVALPRVSKVQQDRSQRIADDLNQAEKRQSEARDLQEQLDQRLAEARAEANKAIAAAHEEASRTADRKLSDLNDRLEGSLRDAESRIAEARAEARAEIDGMAVELCQDIARRLTDDSLPEDAVRAAVSAARGGEERAS